MSKLDNKYFSVNGLRLAEWSCIYAPLNVEAEVQKMVEWLDANPRRRKKNYYRFVINWLNKAHAEVAVAAVKAKYSNIDAQAGKFREGHKGAVYSADDLEYYKRLGIEV